MLESEEREAVCICGHPASRHELMGTEYVRCFLTSKPVCNCVGSYREMGTVPKEAVIYFQRRARGNDRPNSFTGAVAKAREAGFEIDWTVEPNCDRCGWGLYTPDDFTVLALDNEGRLMFDFDGRERQNRLDTGKYQMVCDECLEEERGLLVLEKERKLALEELEYRAALKSGFDAAGF